MGNEKMKMSDKVEEQQQLITELNSNIETTKTRIISIKNKLKQPVFSNLLAEYSSDAIDDSDDVISDVITLVGRIEDSVQSSSQDERISVMQKRVKESEDRILLHLSQTEERSNEELQERLDNVENAKAALEEKYQLSQLQVETEINKRIQIEDELRKELTLLRHNRDTTTVDLSQHTN